MSSSEDVARRVWQEGKAQVTRQVGTAARRQGWKARKSAWLLLPVAGLPWVGFGYLAAKARRPQWAGAAALHLGVSAGAVSALVAGDWWTVLGVLLAGGGWGAGVVHGLAANPRWLRTAAALSPSPSAPWLPPLSGSSSPSSSSDLLGPSGVSGAELPGDPAARAALHQMHLEQLVDVAARAGTALPAGVLPLAREIHDAALPMLARAAGRGRPMGALDLYEVEAVVGEHLPAALGRYLALPPGYVPDTVADGPTPEQALLAQLRSMVELLAEVTERVHEHDARELRVQAAFLGEKVRRSDLDL
ncbi:hypothetical protein SAMN06264364_1293 [Quadrisphaera granulorum]|uniref:Uncharacterized protein n=1 Tax=Quadrisphaera granulorum TaxID=317664 RepID=A0A315ZTI0_9ACTN|nr:hypothetical protein [Quadrisphaera granulorum]PWJ48622.1 hypothetical protein BXY45_1293 [Quadrisphaera granulorum]SZE98344.1 hypothetical protein SAMN06264364_1293 [Quadrisphaera granulorum]